MKFRTGVFYFQFLSQLKYFWNGAAETYLNQAFYCICKIYRNHIDEGAPSQHSPCPLARCGCSENEMLYVHTQSSLVSIIYVKLLYVKCQQAGSEAGSGHPTRKTPTAAPQITFLPHTSPICHAVPVAGTLTPSLSPPAVSVAFSVTDATQSRLKS